MTTGDIGDILLIAFLAFGLMGGLVAFIYFKFGRGLPTTIFANLAPTMAVVSTLAFSLGKMGITINNVGILTPIGFVIITIMLLKLYRDVVTVLSVQMQELIANQSQLSATARQTADSATQQATTVSEVATTVDEIKQTSAAVADMSQEVLHSSEETVTAGKKGLQAAQDAVKIMQAISATRDIVETINSLAEQSNLLALNASIEAAKAGEQGRGFAVVASEVRNLAVQSKTATKQVRDAIEKTTEGQRIIESVYNIINQLAVVLDKSSDRARQISGVALQQSSGIEQIREAMKAMDQKGHDNARASQDLEEAVVNLGNLGKQIERFIRGSNAASG